MVKIDFDFLINKKNDLPAKFEDIWTQFKKYCKRNYSYLMFEKIITRNADTFLLGCRPVKDASASITLAMVKLISENEIGFRFDADEEWVFVNEPGVFAQYLANLMKNPFNQAQFNIMKSLNEQSFFEGFLCEDEPYDITSKSIKFKIKSKESEKLFSLANDDKVNDISAEVKVSIESNVYPVTLTKFDPRICYRFCTFQGFLFEPQEIKDNGNRKLSFKGKFLRNMRM